MVEARHSSNLDVCDHVAQPFSVCERSVSFLFADDVILLQRALCKNGELRHLCGDEKADELQQKNVDDEIRRKQIREYSRTCCWTRGGRERAPQNTPQEEVGQGREAITNH